MTRDVLVFPTSFAQRRLWFLDQVVGDQPVYNVATETAFDWAVDPDHFTRALDVVVRRHEALRTTFMLVDGEPVQVVHETPAIQPAFHDLSGLAPGAREDRLAALAAGLADARFDLAAGPLLRATLVRTSPQSSVALLVMHHIITDGWSSELLEEEIVAACDAERRRVTPRLPDPGPQYGDFAVWQRHQAATRYRDQLAWWVRTLDGAPASLSLPIERMRPPATTFHGASLEFQLPSRLARGIRSLARRAGATSFMATLAAFEYLLARHCASTDIVVGTPVAGRPHPSLDRTLGFFVNTLALRTRLPDALTFNRLLECVREVAVEAYARQDVPFEQVVTEIAPERQPSITPLVQVMFTFDAGEPDDGDESLPGPGSLEIGRAVPGTAKFDLTLALGETPEGLSGVLEYNADLFTEETMRAWVRQYHALLEHAVASPDARLTAEALMPEGEPALLLDAWNDTATAYPRHATIHGTFSEIVRRFGDRVAIVDGGRALTYRELGALARGLAMRLRAAGVGRGACVGVCADRSIELVVSLLGVLECGAAYVPLDPEYPADRLRLMAEDAALEVLLTTAAQRARVADLPAKIIEVDLAVVAAASADTAGLVEPSGAGAEAGAGADAEDVAYVVYTSGSTGRPKGVAVTHRGVVRLVCQTDYLSLGPDDAVALASNTSFDAATFEIWGALLNGARLVVVARDLVLAPRDFVAFLRAQAVTTVFVTTPLFHQIAAMAPAGFGSIRHVLFGGDVVDPGLVRRVLESGAPPDRLLHVYGPTETTTFATWHHVRHVPDQAMTVPIGRPIANTTAYVLDADAVPVPVGVPGEIYLGGDGLARGYLGLPDITAERFVTNPARPGRDERVYRTGDRARWRPDGTLEFLGRVDRQVKIRGFRVEPGEVETVLAQCPGVAQAAVEVRSDATGRHLVGYFAAAPGADLSVAAVRSYLRACLPAHMVPAAFVPLDALPITANGKIDRGALPDPDREPAAPVAAVLPRTAMEETIASVWREVLRRPQVGVDDNFFDLGGQSLLLIQVLERLRPLVGVPLGVIDLFRFPTIAGLGDELAGRAGASASTVPVPVVVPALAIEDRAAQLRRAFAGPAPDDLTGGTR